MSKYSKLRNYLLNITENRIILTFAEIENILGSKPPDSARTYREWWGNDIHHKQAKNGWLAAGWELNSVDFEQEKVEFIKAGESFRNFYCEGRKTEASRKDIDMSWKEFKDIAKDVMSKYFFRRWENCW